MKQEIAVIGYGRFGAVVAEQLRQFFSIGICEKNKSIHLGPEIHRLSLAEAATRNIIVLAVPIGRMKPLLENLAPLLRPKTLVFDVCSVKEQPIQWMKNILPAHSYILGTHPLFGPDSAGKRLAGKPIVLCPVRIPASRFRKIVNALRTTGMDIYVMTPQEHDRLMAKTLFLTQFIGRGLSKLLPPNKIISTENYKLLHHISTTSMNDSIQLFHDMYRYNRFAHHIPDKIIRQFRYLDSTLPRL